MSDQPPKTYDHLSDIDRQVFQKLDLLRAMDLAKRTDPFCELERSVYQLQKEYMQKNRERPTRILMGFSQYNSLKYAPAYLVSQSNEQMLRGTYKLDGLEVIQVIKDDFLEVL